MRILTYKRTHIGDPDPNGCFGIKNCMGQIRGLEFDAVIGIGGIGSSARSHGIDRKINTPAEQAEAQAIVEWALSQPAMPSRRGRHSTAREGCKSKCPPSASAESQGGVSAADLRNV